MSALPHPIFPRVGLILCVYLRSLQRQSGYTKKVMFYLPIVLNQKMVYILSHLLIYSLHINFKSKSAILLNHANLTNVFNQKTVNLEMTN